MTGQWLTAVAGVANLKGRLSALARRVAHRAMLTGIVGALYVIAAGFALAGFTLWLSGLLGPIAACAIVAALLAAFAFAIQFGMATKAVEVAAVAPAAVMVEEVAEPRQPRGRKTGETVADESELSDETVLASAALVSLAGYILGRMVRKS